MPGDGGFRIGFIGLGNQGAPIADRILAAGHTLTVWNRSICKADDLAARGATLASSPAQLGSKVDIVCLCLGDCDAIEQVLFGPNGLVHAAPAPAMVIDHSTISPGDTVRLAERLEREAATRWLDIPVSGGPEGACNGTLALFVGGKADDLAVVAPLLDAYSGKVTHFGALGSGQAAKICNQVVNFGNFLSLAEALALGRSMGLDSLMLTNAMEGGFADSEVMAHYRNAARQGEEKGVARLIEAFARIYEGRDPVSNGPSTILMKDISIIQTAARSQGCPTFVTSMVESLARLMNRD